MAAYRERYKVRYPVELASSALSSTRMSLAGRTARALNVWEKAFQRPETRNVFSHA